MARGEGLYCSDPWCDGDHALPSQRCDDPEPEETDHLGLPLRGDDEVEHHIEPPC